MRAEFCIFESNAPGLKAKFYEPYVDMPKPGAYTHLNAEGYCFCDSGFFCAAPGRHLCSTDHGQIEDDAHAQRHAQERLLWLKNGAHGRRARLARARRPKPVRGSFDVHARFACCLQVGRESLPLCIGNTCELDNWDVHATVMHGDGVEFSAYWPPPRRNVCM